ncbi:MAG: uroporphyrinogen decarboxylase [Treponema sp.]|jgi:uroporphyrinogen-III decarboxylase|nr:uroporphyrinogen decarboxylase [Treponema sp.]
MLTKRQNLLETIHGGKPDRFVNQFEFMVQPWGVDPVSLGNPSPWEPGQETVDGWGVTIRWVNGQPGAFPVHDAAHKVLKDITKWKDTVTCPKVVYPAVEWEATQKIFEAVDRKEQYAAFPIFPGVFEQLHYLMGVDDTLANFYEEPGYMKELIDYITDYELRYAEEYIKYLKPDAAFHHDDWGTQRSSFMSPEMFEEFLLPAYKKIYGYYKSHGIELIVHHADCYAANLVPYMIEMGIDIWQGCISSNNVPELVKKYGPKISFMGDLDNGVLDKSDWSGEIIRKEVERACSSNGKLYFIPNLTMGGDMSTFPGVYEATSKEIERMSREMWK